MMMLLMALSLGVDAFAVSVSCGMTVQDFRKNRVLLLALYFGVFQAGMTLLGAFLGGRFFGLMGEAGRWIACLLLLFIGGEMVVGALRGKKKDHMSIALTHQRMLILSIATSIDAFVAGISLALQSVTIWMAAGIIGGVAFGLSIIGGLFGEQVGHRFQKSAALAGGLVLIALGIRNLF